MIFREFSFLSKSKKTFQTSPSNNATPRCTAQISVTSGGGSRRRIGCRWAPRPQRWWSLDKAAEAGSQPPLPPRRPRWRLRAFSRAAPEANVLACAQPAHIGPGAPAGGLGQAVHIAGEQHLSAACLVGKTALCRARGEKKKDLMATNREPSTRSCCGTS